MGPQQITENATLAENPHRLTKKYHLMAVDNPVGAGFAYTTTGGYVKTELEMRTQFVYALRGFYAKHPEYKNNPLWITGESYGGKYVPNIAYEIATNAKEMPLQGIASLAMPKILWNIGCPFNTLSMQSEVGNCRRSEQS